MTINVLLFAQIADLFGTQSMQMENVEDTKSLISALEAEHEILKEFKYIVAVNEVICKENVVLKDNDAIALLPPFAGG